MADRPAKAEGMNWLTPYLTVKDLKAAIDYYEKTFGFKTTMTMPDKDGNLAHAEMQYRDCIMMLGSECPDAGSKSPTTLSGSPVAFYLYVDGVDAFYEKVKAAGAKVTREIADQFWGDRMFAVKCPEGHQWTFAQNVADYDPSKAPK